MSIFGSDPEVIKFLNELGVVINQMNKKLTDIAQSSNSIVTLLNDNNELLKDISKEICEGQVHVSYQFAHEEIYEKSNKKRKIDLISKMYLDEIIEIKTDKIKNQLHELTFLINSINDKI